MDQTATRSKTVSRPATRFRLPRLDWGDVVKLSLTFFFAFLFILPFIWMMKTSLMTPAQAKQMPPEWLPNPFVPSNYWQAYTAIPFFLYLKNTVIVCALNVIGTVASSALVAWGFTCFRFPYRDQFFALTLATMMIPFPVLMVPQYAIFRELGWIGTFMPLWVPAFLGVPYNIFLLRQFFMGVPKDLLDSARIDGCGEFRTFIVIVLPLVRPALLVVTLFTFLYHWNDFMAPLIYLTNERQFTLALGLQAFQSRLGEVEITLLMAATASMIMPIIVLFFFAQKSFIEGISLTGIKG